MSKNARVIWSEGMFLRPQHYQQYTRYFENLVEQRSSILRPFSWGVVECQLDEKLLGLGKISIDKACGIFPDGTPFSIPDNDEAPLAIDIPAELKESIIYLCIPLRRPGTADIDNHADSESMARYSPDEYEAADNASIGGGTVAIQVGKLRLRLMREDEHRDGYSCIGIAKLTE